MEEKFVTSFDGSKIFYKIKRQNKPWLVFLHGGSGSSNSWMFQAPFFLEQDYSLIVPDQRGHGLSSRGKDLNFFKVDNFVADIAAILKAEKIDRVVLIGHSLGSEIAQKFYEKYPQKTLGLVLISTKFRETRKKVLVTPVNLFMKGLLAVSKVGEPNNNYTDYHRFTNTTDLSPRRILTDISSCSSATYAATIIKGNEFENLHYQDINVPCLLIHGKNDMILPYKPVQVAAEKMKNFRFELLPTNHITLLNMPSEINGLISSFLESVF